MSILVRHAMPSAPQSISPDMNAADAAGMMRSEDVGVMPVVEDGKLVGLVTDRDLVLRVLAERKDSSACTIGDVLTRAPVTVTPDMRLSQARELMAKHKVRRLPVVLNDDTLVGILSIGDVAWQDASIREVGEAFRAVSESDATKASHEDASRGTPQRVQQHRETA